MSAKEAQRSGASCFTLPLDSSRWLRTAAMKAEDKSRGEKGEREEMDSMGKWRLKSLTTTITGSTDVSEESEPESPPPIVRRKVSFADAFGLDLVSIKEFSSQDHEGKVESFLCRLDTDEYYLSCLFTPPSPEILLEKVEEQKVALETITLLPGTTSLRGTVRVANLCFQKAVYVRTTFDCWASHVELLAEYIPGSSDGDTDGFSFRVTMVPPFQPEGVRVEFCLRYETAAGDFWENNNGMNYVVYCRKREQEEKEKRKVKKEKETNGKGKRSCLKASSKKIQSNDYPMEATVDIQDSVSHKAAQRATRKAVDNTDRYASEECLQKTLVDSRRSRRRARMENVKDYFTKRETEAQLGQFSSDEKNSHSLLTPENKVGTWSSATPTTELWRKDYADTGVGKGQVLTYHEIPLQSLSWDRNSRQEDITNTSSHHALWNGPFLEHQTKPIQNELDVSTKGTHPNRVLKNSLINAFEEHSSYPPIAFHSQSSLNQSDLVQPTGFKELVQMAQTETDRDDSQNIIWPQVNPHVTVASSSSGMAEMQESVRHVIGDQEHDEQEGNPASDRAGKRSELQCVTRAPSRSDSALEAVEPDDHQVLHPLSSSDQMPQSKGSHGLKQVTNPRMRLDEAKTAAMASKEVTAWETLALAAQSATQTTTEGTVWQARQTVSQASKNLPPHKPAQSSAEIMTEAKLSIGAIETTGKIALESTVIALEQGEEETIAPGVTEANESRAGEPARTQVSSPSPWVGEGSGRSEQSVNTIAKVEGGESQNHVSPASGDDTVTFTDADGATVREHAHPMRQREGEEEEEEKTMTAERREGEGEHPFKILNEREYKELGEAKTDTIIQKEGDLSQEMSRFKAAGSDVSVEYETDRLKCKVSEEKREDQGVANWKEEMEMCLGLGREQGYVNEPALYEQFTKATKGLERECQRTSDSEMLSAAFGGIQQERCLTEDDSTAPANSAQSEEEQRRVILAQCREELQDVSPNACIEGGSNEVRPVPSIITLVDQQLAQDQHAPIPTQIPTLTLCSIQTTLAEQDPYLFHPDEISPVLQVGAATWSTHAISASLGDGAEMVMLRHRRSPQSTEHFQGPVEEAEIHGQFPGIGAPSSDPEVVSPAPLSMWLSELCFSLSPLSRAVLYAVLFAMFFLTAFVCDLPVCLAIYLFSLCWWCCHGEKQPLPGSKAVD